MTDNMRDIARGTVALFKVLPINSAIFRRESNMIPASEMLKHGFAVVTKGGAPVTELPLDVFDIINGEYGTDTDAFNFGTFHKSFDTVASMSPIEYFTEQFFHYLSTYGAESFGVKVIPYVPVEAINLPNVTFKVDKITIITALETYEVEDMIRRYMTSTTNISRRNLDLILPLSEFFRGSVDDIKSFELKVAYCDKYHKYPQDPTTALRYAIYTVTGSTLLIKNARTIKEIKDRLAPGSWYFSPTTAEEKKAQVRYIFAHVGSNRFATIFFRFKPLFLAFKHAIPGLAPQINHIRRLADAYHQPIGDVNVRNFTQLVKQNRVDDMRHVVDNASNTDLIKLANVLGLMLTDSTEDGAAHNRIYNIRNGRTFINNKKNVAIVSPPNHFDYKTVNHINALQLVCTTLVERLRGSLEGKKFLLPDYISYAAPISEKQFIGNLPWGSYVCCPENGAFTAAIQWYDQKQRVDIDLHLHDSRGEHYGWNSRYHNGREVIYTGDQTAAPLPRGAAEAFWFTPEDDNPFILSVNLFSGPDNTKFKFAMTEQKPDVKDMRSKDYTFENPYFAPVPLQFHGGYGMTLGLFHDRKFYFYGGALTEGIVPNGHYTEAVDAIVGRVGSMWSIEELLNECGATIYRSREEIPEEELEEVIDLSPEALTVTTLLDLVNGYPQAN